MELKSKESKIVSEDKKEGASLAEIGLWCSSVCMLISSMIYGINLNNEDKWFSRLTLGIICFGFAGIIREIRKRK